MTRKDKERIPPNSKESEMMVLGCMLTSINSLNIASDAIDSADFYYTEHKIIFQVLKAAYKSDKPLDLHLVCEELKRQDKLKNVGGAAYLMTLAQYAGTSAHIEEYCGLVRDKAMLRSMINVSQIIERKALDGSEDVFGLLNEAQQAFSKIEKNTGNKLDIKFLDAKSVLEKPPAKPMLS